MSCHAAQVTDPTSRLLRLLGLLQSRSVWSGEELAERLGSHPRTVRRDIARLRALGYRVDSAPGVGGGYRITGGSTLPPLLLDDEAVAMVACLRMAALDGSDPIGEAALRALVKLHQLLPGPARSQVAALTEAVATLPAERPEVDWRLMTDLAQARRDRRLVRLEYRDHAGVTTERDVEPAALLAEAGRWYLIGYDRLRDDWRIFRLDRVQQAQVLSFGFEPRTAPPARQVLRGRELQAWPHQAVVELGCDAARVRAMVPRRHGEVVADEPGRTRLRVGASQAEDLAWWVAWTGRTLGASLRVVSGDSLRAALARLGSELLELSSPGTGHRGTSAPEHGAAAASEGG